MLYGAEHAWLACRCKITLSHRTFKAPLLSPLQFFHGKQAAKFQKSRLKCQAKADREPACVCVCLGAWGRDKEGRRENFSGEQRKSCSSPVFLNHSFGVTSQASETEQVKLAREVWRGRNSTWVFQGGLPLPCNCKETHHFFSLLYWPCSRPRGSETCCRTRLGLSTWADQKGNRTETKGLFVDSRVSWPLTHISVTAVWCVGMSDQEVRETQLRPARGYCTLLGAGQKRVNKPLCVCVRKGSWLVQLI